MANGRRRGIHVLLSSLAVFTIIFVLLGAALAGYWYLGPYKAFGDETFVEIEHGMSSRAIARQLATQGVVRSSWAFYVIRLLHPTANLQAGEYRFASEETPWQVFNKIRRGEIFFEEFTVPEGSNIFDIAALLRNSDTV
ncbi:MAG: endolytic transglycosylase MltG, partial [Acidobacteriaceae bacterium]|nr:endolytic transglycosylase MltG [Acidobacteriaceae bacterium]